MSSEAGKSPPPLHSVDHVFIHTDHAREMFALFRDAFGLPVAWPFGLYGTIQTGGLRAGNMNIEFGRFEGFDCLGTHLFGLGFAPAQPTWQMVQGLVARGIPHTPPVTVRYREPIPIAFTNTFLGGLLDDDLKSPFWLGCRLGGDRWTCLTSAASTPPGPWFQSSHTQPSPWDLPLSRQNGSFLWGGWHRPAIPAAGSALWSHPCVAIPSAQVKSV